MNKTLLKIVFLTLLFAKGGLAHTELGANYQDLSGCQKQEILWDQIKKTEHRELPAIAKFGAIELAKMGLQSMKTKVYRNEDTSPHKWEKYLHKRGAVAKVRIVPAEDSKYTGVLLGTECALLRMSITYRPTKKRNFAPGLALKFLKDGRPSANISALYRLEGQGKDYNIFANPLSNIVPIGDDIGLKLVHRIFSRVTNYPEELLLNHLAKEDQRGEKVESFTAPRQIFFVPQMPSKFSSKPHDFRSDLLSLSKGETLYKVYAAPQRLEQFNYANYSSEDIKRFLSESIDNNDLVGEIVLDSTFVASEFGDQGLFFRHETR